MATEKTTTAETRPPIAVWRERMGYTLDDAASDLGVSAAQVSEWESGAAPTPRAVSLAMVALALGLSPFDGK